MIYLFIYFEPLQTTRISPRGLLVDLNTIPKLDKLMRLQYLQH